MTTLLDTLAPDKRAAIEAIASDRFRAADLGHPLASFLYEKSMETMARENIWQRPEPDASATGRKRSPSGAAELAVRDISLPTIPQVGIELQRVLEDPSSSATDLARVISMDPKLTASVLRMVNSALYNLRQPVETVHRAVAVLGTHQISSLALGTLLLNLFKKNRPAPLDLNRFWKHSVACGVIARAMARTAGLEDPERFFVAGLLHDIGRMVIMTEEPEVYRQVVQMAEGRNISLYDAERQILGYDHAKLGGMILRKWRFPLSLVSAVIYHHSPQFSVQHSTPHVIHLANISAKVLGLAPTDTEVIEPLYLASWESLGIEVYQIADFMDTCQDEINQIFNALIPEV
ncbi:MAG: HDOD domain-containing protein [Deltaproteobacteria bacterium]|nr:HDOD domain-containing protein [Deltaproteobacteria bacterium]